jgi:hypothetical protein
LLYHHLIFIPFFARLKCERSNGMLENFVSSLSCDNMHKYLLFVWLNDAWNIYYSCDSMMHEIFIIRVTQWYMKYLLFVCLNDTWNIYYSCVSMIHEIFIICVIQLLIYIQQSEETKFSSSPFDRAYLNRVIKPSLH